MAQNSKTNVRSNVKGGDSSGAMATGGDENRLQPTEFANIGALLASIPAMDGNSFAAWTPDSLKVQGATLIDVMTTVLEYEGDPSLDVEGFNGTGVAKQVAQRSAEYNSSRIITALSGAYAYAHASMAKAADRLAGYETRILNVEDDATRQQIWGLVKGSERAKVEVAAREADAHRLGWMIQGAVDAFEARFGAYKMPVRGGEASVKSTKDMLAAVRAQIVAKRGAA